MPPRSVEPSRVTRQNFRTGNRKLRRLSVLCQLSGRDMIAGEIARFSCELSAHLRESFLHRIAGRATEFVDGTENRARETGLFPSIINNPSSVSIVRFLYRYSNPRETTKGKMIVCQFLKVPSIGCWAVSWCVHLLPRLAELRRRKSGYRLQGNWSAHRWFAYDFKCSHIQLCTFFLKFRKELV